MMRTRRAQCSGDSRSSFEEKWMKNIIHSWKINRGRMPAKVNFFQEKWHAKTFFKTFFHFMQKNIHFLKQKLIKFWTFHKKFWSLQIVRIVRENRIWFLDQIWVKFDSRFCKNQIASLETIDPNLTFWGRCRYIILNGALSSKNQIPFSL